MPILPATTRLANVIYNRLVCGPPDAVAKIREEAACCRITSIFSDMMDNGDLLCTMRVASVSITSRDVALHFAENEKEIQRLFDAVRAAFARAIAGGKQIFWSDNRYADPSTKVCHWELKQICRGSHLEAQLHPQDADHVSERLLLTSDCSFPLDCFRNFPSSHLCRSTHRP